MLGLVGSIEPEGYKSAVCSCELISLNHVPAARGR
jgi:hypothetical protein